MNQSNYVPFLKADEIPDLLRALESQTGSKLVQIAMKLLMITGVRTTELRAALWQEFDLDNAIQEIPAERMKMRRPHLVPLSTQALDLLHELKTMTGNYHYVFPGQNDSNKPMSEASINQVIKRIGYAGQLTVNGFRHSMSTILHEQGYDTVWVELQLANDDKNSIRGTCNHAQYIDKRSIMLQWYAEYILGIRN